MADGPYDIQEVLHEGLTKEDIDELNSLSQINKLLTGAIIHTRTQGKAPTWLSKIVFALIDRSRDLIPDTEKGSSLANFFHGIAQLRELCVISRCDEESAAAIQAWLYLCVCVCVYAHMHLC